MKGLGLFFSFIILILGILQPGNWLLAGSKVSNKKDDEGHIFRNSRGHFAEDTPENRALIESATESSEYKVCTNRFGADFYLRTLPTGMQVWAEVYNGVITNGGRNLFPLKWVPDASDKGGRFVSSKYTELDPSDSFFRGAVTINRLVRENGWLQAIHPSKWGSREVVQGVEGQYGKIGNLLEEDQKRGTHHILLPVEIITKEEAYRILREVAQGIFVYDAVPMFSLHFNRSMEQYPILYPHYRKTLTGEAIAMLDYWMKSAVNGRYFERDFIDSWENKKNFSQKHLLKNSKDFHELCESLNVPYRSFYDILEELRAQTKNKTINAEIGGSFRIVGFQNRVCKSGNSVSFEPGFKIDYDLDPRFQSLQGFDLVENASKLMSKELELVMVEIPFLKRYFEILHLANFFSYYCLTLKEQNVIPLLVRDLSKEQVLFRGCPNLFPPIPISTENFVEIQFSDFLRCLIRALNIDSRHIFEEENRDFFSSALGERIGEARAQEIQEFSQAVFDFCKTRFMQSQANWDQFFQSIGINQNSDVSEAQTAFFQRIDRIIRNSEGKEKAEMQNLRSQAVNWFEDPFDFVFKDSGMKYNLKTGSFYPVNQCYSQNVQIGGGCGFPIHRDLHAEENSTFFAKDTLKIIVPFAEMEREEWDDSREVAKGYLFPPLPGYSLNNSKLFLLNAIAEEDLATFDKKKNDLWWWEWNFCDPMGRYFVHHAARANTGHFLSHLVSKWAKLDVKDPSGWTPLHHAAEAGSSACVEILLSNRPNLLNERGDDGETPFFVAVQNGRSDIVCRLLEAGANPNCINSLGLNPLMWAIFSKQNEIVEVLLNVPSIDLDRQTVSGETALELAVQTRSLIALKRLCELGVDLNRYHRGMTPLHLAIVLGWKEGVELLWNHPNVDIELITSNGESCVSLLEKANNGELLRF